MASDASTSVLHLSAFGRVRSRAGGKTGAMLARNRMLTRELGLATTILTFDPSPGYDEVRTSLEERGELVSGMRLLNLFEWYRDAGPDDLAVDGEPPPTSLPALDHRCRATDLPYATSYADPATGRELARDHHRRDGSVFVRVHGGESDAGPRDGRVVLVDHDGRAVRTFAGRRAWHQHWLSALARDADRVVLVTDTDTVLDQLWPVPDPRFALVHVLHEIHVRMTDGDLWSAPLLPTVAPLFEHLDRLDALVLLTEGQRRDVERRVGEGRTALPVIPNSVRRPTPLPSSAASREPATFVMLARLAPAKAIDEAVRAFALVVARHPQARLEVYGDGALRDDLQRLIDGLGLAEHVLLRGYDPRGKERLSTATGFVSAASKETFGLGIVEALGHGCPVVAYDVPYGPPELVDDGVDGVLVPCGDTAALAARIVELIESPADVHRMSAAAVEAAARFEPSRVALSWRTLLDRLDRLDP